MELGAWAMPSHVPSWVFLTLSMKQIPRKGQLCLQRMSVSLVSEQHLYKAVASCQDDIFVKNSLKQKSLLLALAYVKPQFSQPVKETEKNIWHCEENMRWLRDKSSPVSDEFLLWEGFTQEAAAAKSEQDPCAQYVRAALDLGHSRFPALRILPLSSFVSKWRSIHGPEHFFSF